MRRTLCVVLLLCYGGDGFAQSAPPPKRTEQGVAPKKRPTKRLRVKWSKKTVYRFRYYPKVPPAGSVKTAIKVIRFERTMCFGSCPAYVVTLHADGRARYEGKAYAPRSGAHAGKIYPWQFKRLAHLLQHSGFFKLHKRYARSITCSSSAITSAQRHGRWHRVENYAGAGPVALWSIQQAIDSITHDVSWKPVRSAKVQPLPSAQKLRLTILRDWQRVRKARGLRPLDTNQWLDSWARRDLRRSIRKLPRINRYGRQLYMRLDTPIAARWNACGSNKDPRHLEKDHPAFDAKHQSVGLYVQRLKSQHAWCLVAFFSRKPSATPPPTSMRHGSLPTPRPR